MTESTAITLIIGLLLGVLLISVADMVTDSQSGRVIVKHGCAQYNSTTGDFEWLEKSDVK